MGFLFQGQWRDEWYDTKKSGGRFLRQDSHFRHQLGSQEFPIEKDRYHLIVSPACPWAHRCLIFRALKGLEDWISLSEVDAVMLDKGWVLRSSEESFGGLSYLYELYLLSDSAYEGRVTVPVLWDKKQKCIINNESSDIIRQFNHAFKDVKKHDFDYYPEALRDEIDKINDMVYHNINNGVYKVGFATNQKVYEEAFDQLFSALDQLDQLLSKNRYLCGDVLTEADWRLFTTLIRFDAVYVGHFKCNLKQIKDYPNLSGFLRELYQMPKIKETLNMNDIKTHYYVSHPMINANQIVPKGPELDFDLPHGREKLS